MRAIIQSEYGTSEVLSLGEVDRPTIAKDEVLVQVHAAALDRGTWHLMAGLPYVVRLGFGLRAPKNPVPGLDVAGTVVAVGEEVTTFSPGDEVFGVGKGSWAEYTAAKESKLAIKPETLSFEAAAALPISGLTALQALRDIAKVEPGQHVLVLGASGGVGSYAVQIAKAFGADVTGVCSTGKLEYVRSLGADHVIDYTAGDWSADGARYDVILDMGGNSRISKLRSSLTPTGTLVIVGGENGGKLIGGVQRQLGAITASPFVKQRLTAFLSKEKGADIEELGKMVQAGTLTSTVDRTYPLAEAAHAMRDMENGTVRGKVVITV
ncbi:MAG: NAD(P)-dependent alcohol dehydrogenase [Actinobacteria bacterium]|nr:NAD(P)-dependent alcohol dehydrogenase [Actinomycetota bacterium]